MVHFCWSYGEQKKEHRGCIDLQWLKDNSYSMMKLKDLQKHCQPLPTAIVSLCFNISSVTTLPSVSTVD